MKVYLALWTDGIGAVAARAFKTAELRDELLTLIQPNTRNKSAAFGGWEAMDVELEEAL